MALRPQVELEHTSDPEIDRFARLAARIVGAARVSVLVSRPSSEGFGPKCRIPELSTRAFSAGRPVLGDGSHTGCDAAAYLGVPLPGEERVLGVLALEDDEPRAWTTGDIESVEALARAIAQTLDLRRAKRELGRNKEILKGLRTVEDSLRQQTHLFTAVLASMRDTVVVADTTGNVVMSNERSKEAMVAADGRVLDAAAHPLARAIRGDVVDQLEVRIGATWLSVNASPLVGPKGDVIGGISVARDISEGKKLEAAAHEQHAQATLLQEVAIAAQHARSSAEALGKVLELVARHADLPLAHVIVPVHGQHAPTERWYRAPDIDVIRGNLEKRISLPVDLHGETVAVLEFFGSPDRALSPLLSSTMVQVGELVARVVERERTQRELEHHAEEVRAMSLRDDLTGLYNRRGFVTLAEQHAKLAQRRGRSFLLFFADMDGLKAINDELGHEVGDRAIRAGGEALRKTFREADIVARLGGDEFVVLIADADEQALAGIEKRLDAVLASAHLRHEVPRHILMSTGAALYDPACPEDIETLLRKADAVMYAEKRRRKQGRQAA